MAQIAARSKKKDSAAEPDPQRGATAVAAAPRKANGAKGVAPAFVTRKAKSPAAENTTDVADTPLGAPGRKRPDKEQAAEPAGRDLAQADSPAPRRKREPRPEATRGNDDFATGSDAPLLEPPRSLEKALGAQVRLLRRERDLSLGDLAAAAGLSSGMLSKIENGQISPSLSTINALADALNTPFTSLFTAFEEKLDCSFVPAGSGARIERRGTKAGHVYQLLGKVLGGSVSVEPYLITLERDAVPYAAFRHAGVELIYMLTGEVVYRHGDECYRLKPGDSLLFDSGALHGPERLIEVPMTYLSIIVYPRQQDR